MKKSTVLCMSEAAAMLALAFVLSFIKVIDLPFGGAITACSMLPIALFAYRRGIKWGLLASFVYSLLQLVMGLNNLQYATSWVAAVAIIMLDYVVAFAVLGFAGMFKGKIENQPMEATFGVLIVCLGRYICHVISGCTVWAGVSIPTGDGLLYSLVYNASYMVPETIITLIAAWYVCSLIDFRNEKITGYKHDESVAKTTANSIATAVFCGAIAFDVLYLFRKIETEESFDITGIKNINPWLFFGVLLGGLLLTVVVHLIARSRKK